jgi:hypothetical protein
MSLAVLIPYRPDNERRERIYDATSRLWAARDVEVIHSDDGLTGPQFSYSRAANRARAKTDAECLITYSVDALPPSAEFLERIERELTAGLPWSCIFTGQQRFTPEQTGVVFDGGDPGPAAGEVCMGHEALMAVRADVWDELRGMDERFVGWGAEDMAFYKVLSTVYPDGCDVPTDCSRRSGIRKCPVWRGGAMSCCGGRMTSRPRLT